jgi:mono/diheme cytochrome c family protein
MENNIRLNKNRKIFREGPMKKSIVGVITIFALAFTLVDATFAAELDLSEGKQLYQKKCAECHDVVGGRRIGPDIAEVGKNRDATWLVNFISNPKKVIKSGDPIAVKLFEEYNEKMMPNPKLSSTEIANVLGYVASDAYGGPAGAIKKVRAPRGDIQRGIDYITGALPLKNGGAACMSCHHVNGLGLFGGGTLGVDLTNIIKKYDKDNLFVTLSTLPFPTMKANFKGKKLTKQERADIVAFLDAKYKEKSVKTEKNFLSVGFLSFIVLIIVPFIIWKKRHKNVRRNLIGGKE